MIRVGIVDDRMINRKTVRKNLETQPGMTIVLEAVNGSDFMEQMTNLPDGQKPEVVLMDIDMPVMNGIDAIAVGSIRFPETRFLVLTVFDDDEKIFEAIQVGALGYLLKDDSDTQLGDAIREVLAFNGAPMSPAIARKTLQWLKSGTGPVKKEATPEPLSELLSNREMEIIRLMVQGKDYRQIAAELFVSPHTVRKHISHIYEKLHINSKAQAVQLAYKYGWISG